MGGRVGWSGRAIKVVMTAWVAGYFLIFRAPAVVSIFAATHFLVASLIVFLSLCGWSTVFYLLLLRVGGIDEVRRYLLRSRQDGKGQGVLARLRARLSKAEDAQLASFWWVLFVFIFSDAFAGVLAVRFIYPAKFEKRALALIWAGCALDVLTWTLPVYGLPTSLICKLAGVWSGGG